MKSAIPAARHETEINDWPASATSGLSPGPSEAVHETPTLLTFTRSMGEQELSEMLTRKFREFFP
jgi:hypothetical protein